MEWTGNQQLGLLLESGGLGLLLGFLFDVNSGLSRATPGGRAARFLRDTFFGLLAALITFYVSLAIMDGRLHPLLFCGSAVGFWLEHSSVGRWVSRWTCRFCCAWHRCSRRVLDAAEGLVTASFRWFCGIFHRKNHPEILFEEENGINSEKSRKKFPFFQKKS